MLLSVLAQFKTHPSLRSLFDILRDSGLVSLHGLGGSSSSFLAAALLSDSRGHTGKQILAVLSTAEEAEIFRDDVESIVGPDRVRYFPERDTHPYEHHDSHFEVRCQRVETLDALDRGWEGIVVSSIGAIHDPTTPPGLVELVSYEVRKGERVNFDDFVRSLISRGFKRCATVTEAGQIAVRGGIVDIFPFGGELPYRVEFWGDEIESIRSFSSATQRSLEETGGFRIIPPDEFITVAGLTPDIVSRIETAEKETGVSLARLKNVFSAGGDRPNGIEHYLYLVFGGAASLLSHFSGDAIVCAGDPERCSIELGKRMEYLKTQWDIHRHEDLGIISPDRLFASPDDVMASLHRLPLIENYTLRPPGKVVLDFDITSSRQYNGAVDEVRRDISAAHAVGLACHIACDNKGQADRLNELLVDIEDEFSLDVARISAGFTDRTDGIMLLTDHEIFSRYRRRIRYRRFKEGAPIPDYRSLRMGDFVVHTDFGIGRYMGLKRMEAGAAETDCLLIRYRGDDRLFLPIDQLKRLKKFTSEEGVMPVVNQLGGTAWDKLKERTKKSIERMAKDLLSLYAERKAFPGHEFLLDGVEAGTLRAFVDSFVFEDTPDQRRSWEEIKADLETPSPMDRLLCGDVGFGKTEVAIRAAMMVVLNGMQVLMLVPTTILADQHEETFRDRFADFPITVESLSRFRTGKEQKEVLERLASGRVDIVIGTHRLLSKDVHVKNLGLLVIDEEQRFGVRHKERIKQIRRNVDVLSLSATPIPRTLNMSLSGARDISFITTPPPDRYSVHTQIVPFEEQFVVEAIMREIDRGGQVYFVHNRVRSIDSIASYLQALLPSVSFGVAHGQLPERELEKVMRDFHNEKFQVLVSTMIIENGLDIPSVNTILINRADTFGLAQLYQLRGRVGRSNRRAFAYLLVPPKVTLSKTARQRLQIIEEFAELGSGFKIAMRDLEIRGAGNILGTEQSGFIAAVGFDLYTELLRETISELKGEILSKPPDVELHLKDISRDTFLPEEYVPDSNERVVFYRRLSEAMSVHDVERIEDELRDRFGRPGEPVRNLLDSAYIRHYAAGLHVSEVTVDDNRVMLYVAQDVAVTRDSIEDMVKNSPVKLQFSFDTRGMTVSFETQSVLQDGDGILPFVKKVLQAISN